MNREQKSWILYDVGNSAYILIVTTALMPVFYKSYAAVGMSDSASTAQWGFANSAASLVLALAAPILGTLSDYNGNKLRFLKFFILAGTFSTLLLTLITKSSWLTALIIYAVSMIGYSAANIFYDSLLPDVAQGKDMDRVSALGYAWGYIGSVIPFVLVIGLLFAGEKLGLQAEAVKTAFVITAAWWLLFSLPLLRNVKQKYFLKKRKRYITHSFLRLISISKEIGKNKNAFIFMAAYFFYIDGVDTIIRMAVPYGKDAGLGTGELLLAVLFIQILAFPFALAYGKMSEFFGAKKLIFIAITIYLLTVLLGFFLPQIPDIRVKSWVFWLLAFLIATSQGGIQSLSRSLFGRIIPKEKSGEFFGFYNIFGKFAAIAGPFIMSMAIWITGESKYGILSLSILFLVGAGLLYFVKEEHSRTISK
ncbi:MAG: MFS transporter [Lentisphaerae bacterium GWF2_45_14]|nr:MAG: MFS transporter [Lentisphaerae bacterium GWF2_45_14]